MNLYYTKCALYAYPNILAVMEQIDELVERRALTSMSDFSPCEEQCEKIIALTNQKDVLIELKLITDKVLSKITDYQKDCLDYKYFKQKPKEYFIGFDTTSRGYFRRQIRAVERVSELFTKFGATDEWFEQNCLEMEFFRELLRRVKLKEEKLKKNKQVNKSIQQSLSLASKKDGQKINVTKSIAV